MVRFEGYVTTVPMVASLHTLFNYISVNFYLFLAVSKSERLFIAVFSSLLVNVSQL